MWDNENANIDWIPFYNGEEIGWSFYTTQTCSESEKKWLSVRRPDDNYADYHVELSNFDDAAILLLPQFRGIEEYLKEADE